MEPTTLTAAAIATLAFTKFLESSAGKVAEKFTEAAIVKMDNLRKLVWAKLIGRDPELRQTAQAIEQSRQITSEQVNEIADHLQIAMKKEPQFAQQVQTLAYEITQMRVEDHSHNTQNNYGGTNTQVNTGPNNTNFIGGSHHHSQK